MENTQPEPSMEEILASIRRIISEDEAQDGDDAAAASGQSTEAATTKSKPPAQKSASKSPPTMKPVEPAQGAKQVEEQSLSKEKDSDMTAKNTAEILEAVDEDPILDATAAAAASDAFDALSQNVKVDAGDGRTLEQLVVTMLRPMVKEWLEANLPAIVEDKVEEEVRRLARRRR
ncbi:MAG: DUF2497 domain-containing protein [Pseudomonadota bacterium]